MAHQAEPRAIRGLVPRVPAGRQHHGRRGVLETPAAFEEHVEEHIPPVGDDAPELVLTSDDALDVGDGTLLVPHALAAEGRDDVLGARGFEGVEARVAHGDRRVDELVVVAGEVAMRLVGVRVERGDHLRPAFGQCHAQILLEVQAFDRHQERRRAVDERHILVHEVRPNARLTRVDPVAEHDALRERTLRRTDAPAVLAHLDRAQRLPIQRRRADVLEVAGELADQIGTRCPDRHHHVHVVARGREDRLDLEVVRGGRGEVEGVLDDLAVGSRLHRLSCLGSLYRRGFAIRGPRLAPDVLGRTREEEREENEGARHAANLRQRAEVSKDMWTA